MINGNKTYLAAAALVLYMWGGKLGWWPEDSRVVTTLSAAAVVFLRHAIAKVADSAPESDSGKGA